MAMTLACVERRHASRSTSPARAVGYNPYSEGVSAENEWDEDDYVRYLREERERYAWIMRRYGGLDSAQADAAAQECYPYEPADKPWRELVFHDEAWHWAMLRLHGDQYWQRFPELAEPPPEYRALD
jgi:hypothetical protein